MATKRRKQQKRRSLYTRIITAVLVGAFGSYTLLKTFAVSYPYEPEPFHTVAQNPPITACGLDGLDMVLVADRSSSVINEQALINDAIKSAIDGMIPSTKSEIALVDFANGAYVTQPFTTSASVLDAKIGNYPASIGAGTDFLPALNAVAGLFAADPRPSVPNLVIFITDGNAGEAPNAPPWRADDDIAVANKIKSYNVHMLVATVVSTWGFRGPYYLIQELSGTNVNTGNPPDVKISSYANLANDLKNILGKTCSGFGKGGTGTGSGGSGTGTGGSGSGSGGSGAGSGSSTGSSPSGSSATTAGNTNKQAPTTSSQGTNTKPPQQTPSPFFDGKQYASGSEPDTSGGGSVTEKASKHFWWWIILLILVIGVAIAGWFRWKPRNRSSPRK